VTVRAEGVCSKTVMVCLGIVHSVAASIDGVPGTGQSVVTARRATGDVLDEVDGETHAVDTRDVCTARHKAAPNLEVSGDTSTASSGRCWGMTSTNVANTVQII
jgi:hypothetical protein